MFLNQSEMLSIGMLTYPLYLLNQNFGFMIFNLLGLYINKYVLLVLVLVLMLMLAHFLNKYIESKFSIYFQSVLHKSSSVIFRERYFLRC